MGRKEVKIDCHVHSRFSRDSLASLWAIEETAKRKNLDGIVLMDHDTIAGEVKALQEKNQFLILGEEILTGKRNPSGQEIEIGGLLLQEPIKPGQTITETLGQINEQGGIVVLPHPFEEWRHGAGEQASRAIIRACLKDNIPVAVEIYNARAIFPKYNLQAESLWQEFRSQGVLATAGSDAHRAREIGRAYIGILGFQTREEFILGLRQPGVCGQGNVLGTAFHRLMNRAELLVKQAILKRG